MWRSLLRFFNGPIFVLLAMGAIGIQTALFQTPPLVYFTPQLLLLWVIWCALKRDFLEGGVLTLVLAEVAEIHSAVPRGVYFLTYMIVYLVTRLTSRVVVLPNALTLGVYALICSCTHSLLSTVVLILLGHPQPLIAGAHTYALVRQGVYSMLPTAVATAALGYFSFRWFKQFDWITFKDPQSQQVAGEIGGSLFEEEGL